MSRPPRRARRPRHPHRCTDLFLGRRHPRAANDITQGCGDSARAVGPRATRHPPTRLPRRARLRASTRPSPTRRSGRRATRTGIPLELLMVHPCPKRSGLCTALGPDDRLPRRRGGDRCRSSSTSSPRGSSQRRWSGCSTVQGDHTTRGDRRAGGRLVVLGGDRSRAMAAGKGGPEEMGNPNLAERISPLSRARRSSPCTTRARSAPGPPTSSGQSKCDRASGAPQSPRTAAGDLLPRHDRVHEADPGARGRCGRGPRQATVARLVRRSSVGHGGRPIEWLGDGVMFYFAGTGPGRPAALEMVGGLAAAGLPPCHVGLHAGRSCSRRVTTSARRSTSARDRRVRTCRRGARHAGRRRRVARRRGVVQRHRRGGAQRLSGTVNLLRADLA